MKIEKSNISTVQRGRIVVKNFRRTRQIRQTPYNSRNCLPARFLPKLKLIFDDLSSADLLSKCLDGYTQNANESLHGMIWSWCPKAKSFGMQQVQFAVSSAISEFNLGAKFHTSLLESMNVSPGTYTTLYCEELDKQRIYHAERKSGDKFNSLLTNDGIHVINQFSTKQPITRICVKNQFSAEWPMTRIRVMGTFGVFFERSGLYSHYLRLEPYLLHPPEA